MPGGVARLAAKWMTMMTSVQGDDETREVRVGGCGPVGGKCGAWWWCRGGGGGDDDDDVTWGRRWPDVARADGPRSDPARTDDDDVVGLAQASVDLAWRLARRLNRWANDDEGLTMSGALGRRCARACACARATRAGRVARARARARMAATRARADRLRCGVRCCLGWARWRCTDRPVD